METEGFFYSFIWERESEQRGEAEAEGEADSPLSGGPDVGLDPGALDRDLSRGQLLNEWATQAPTLFVF